MAPAYTFLAQSAVVEGGNYFRSFWHISGDYILRCSVRRCPRVGCLIAGSFISERGYDLVAVLVLIIVK